MGTRDCAVCGPTIGPCVSCGAKSQHGHLAYLDRRGRERAQVPLCASCSGRVAVGGLAGGASLERMLGGCHETPEAAT